MSAAAPNEGVVRFAVALARAAGAVHAAVAVTLLAPGKVPVALALGVGGGVFYATGRPRGLTPQQAGAVGYAAPLAALLLARLAVVNPPGFDAAQVELFRFFAAVCRATPVPCYLLAVVYALSQADLRSGRGPFDPPGR